MNGYEKILKIMVKQGNKENEKGVFLGVVGENLSVDIGDIVIEKEDLVISQHLLTGYKAADGETVPAAEKGDLVLLKRLSDEKYAVITKVISQE
jgi:hypothetical protein